MTTDDWADTNANWEVAKRKIDEAKGRLLTVGTLRALLAAFPDETIVETEGCDCEDEAGGVRQKGEDRILITRREQTTEGHG